MAMQTFEVYSNMEWDSPPSYYYTDPEFYSKKRVEVMEALKQIDADYAMFWWYGEPENAGFLEEAEEETEETIDVDGTLFQYVPDHLLEVRWEGPHIKMFKDGSIQIKFTSKHTNDECWFDIS